MTWTLAGAGSAGDPWVLTTAAHWLEFCDTANAARLGDHFELGADILSTMTVTPVGLYSGTAFTGTFNGKGYMLGDFTVTASENGSGVFGHINGATIYDLDVRQITCSNAPSLNYIAAVVGWMDSSTLTNVHYVSTSRTINGRQCGCMVGYMTGTGCAVTQCSVHLSGTAAVVSQSGNNSGMFAGPAKGTFTDCLLYSDGISFTGAANYHGGMCGQGVTDVAFVRCTVVLKDCTLRANGQHAGGLMGRNANKTTVTDCGVFLLGTALIRSDGNSAGGLWGDVSDTTYTSEVTGSFVYVASGAEIRAGRYAGALLGAATSSVAVADCEAQIEGTVNSTSTTGAGAGLITGYANGASFTRVRVFGAGTVTNSGTPSTAAAHGPFMGYVAAGGASLSDLQMASDLTLTNCDTAISGTGVVHNSTIVASSNWRSASVTGDTTFAPTSTDYWHPLNGLASGQPAQLLESSVVVDSADSVFAPLGELQHDLPTPTWVRFSYDAGTETLTVTYKSVTADAYTSALPDQTFSAEQYLVALTSNYELSSTAFSVAPGALEMLYNWMSTDSFSLWPTDASGYYQISSVNQLRGIYCFIGLYHNDNFVLTADLDFAGETWGWYPTGAGSTKCLNGTFDGGGFTISNMFFQANGPYGNGLYSLSSGGKIQNLTMDGTVLTTGTCGGLVGRVQTGFSANDCRVIHSVAYTSGSGYYGGVAAVCYSGVTLTRFSLLCRADLQRSGYAGGVIGIKQDNGSTFKCIDCTVVVDAGCTFSCGDVGGLGGRVLGDMWAQRCAVVVQGSLYATTGRAGGLYGYGSGSSTKIDIADTSVYVTGTGSISNATGGSVGGFVGYTNSTLASTMARNYLYVGPGASLSAPTGTCAPFMATFLTSALTSVDDRLHVDGTVTSGGQPTGLICGYGTTSSVSVTRFQATGSGTLTGSAAATEGPFVGTGVAQGAVADSFRATTLGGNFDTSTGTLTTSFVAAADLQSAATPGASTFVPSSADFFHPRGLANNRPAMLSAARNTVVVESAAAFDTVFGSVTASFGSYPAAVHFELTAAGEVTCSAESLASPQGSDDYYSLDVATPTAWGVTLASAASGYLVYKEQLTDPGFLVDGAALSWSVSSGDGSGADPWQIASVQDLRELSDYGNSARWGDSFLQTADVAFSTQFMAQIGNATVPFTGAYDGGGFTVSGNVVSDATGDYKGMFGLVSGGSVENVVLESWEISCPASNYVGYLIGSCTGASVVSNCHVTDGGSALVGYKVVGGLAGAVYGSSGTERGVVTGCSVRLASDVTSTRTGTTAGTHGVAAGLVGDSRYTDVSGCLVHCSATISAQVSIAALLVAKGSNSSQLTVTDCVAVLDGGSVSAFYYVGGVCGYSYSTSTICSASRNRVFLLNGATLSTSGNTCGGVCGYARKISASGNFVYIGPGSAVTANNEVAGVVGNAMTGTTVNDNVVQLDGTISSTSTGDAVAALLIAHCSIQYYYCNRNYVYGSGALTAAGAGGTYPYGPLVARGAENTAGAGSSDCFWSDGISISSNVGSDYTYADGCFVASGADFASGTPTGAGFTPASDQWWHPRGLLGKDTPALLHSGSSGAYTNGVVLTSATAVGTVLGTVTIAAAAEDFPLAVFLERSADLEMTLRCHTLAPPAAPTADLDAPAPSSFSWGCTLTSAAATGQLALNAPELCYLPVFTVSGAPLLGLEPAGDGAYEIADARTFAHLGGLAGMDSWMAQDFRLTADVDLDGYTVAPLGTTTDKFTGSFDGGGFRVANASVSPDGGLDCLGLFGRVSSATLSNLTVADTTVAGGALSYVGGVVGRADSSSIEDVHYESTAASSLGGHVGVGGVVGFAYGSSGASRTLVTRSSARLGGALAAADAGCGALCGEAENADFTDCLCLAGDGAALSAGAAGAGGVVGRHAAGASALLRCTSVFRAATLADSTSGTGGVLGQIVYGLTADSSVTDCHAFFMDTASAYSALGAGGVVGRGGCAVSGCSVYVAPGATVSAASAAGGVFGHAWAGSSVTDCTVQIDGTVSAAGADPDTGVLVGLGKTLTVSRCLAMGGGTFENTGATSAAESGPLVGVVDASGAAAAVSDCQLSAGLTLTAMDDSIAGGTLASYESTVRVAADWESVLETGASAFAPASSHFWHPRGLATGAPAALLEQGLVLTGNQSAPSPLGAVAAALDAGAFPAWARCSFDAAGAGQATWSFWSLAASNLPLTLTSGTYEMPAAVGGGGGGHVVTTRDYCLGSLFSAAAAAGHSQPILYNWAVPGDPAWTQAGDGYLEVASVAQLRALGQYVTLYGGSNFRLTADLDFAGETFGWVPAGHDAAPFAGALDGAGRALSNLWFQAESEHGSALLGTASGAVLDLTLVGAQFPATGDCAGLATRAASGFVSSGCVVRMTSAYTGSGDFGGLAAQCTGGVTVESFRFEAHADLLAGGAFGGVAARASGASNALSATVVVATGVTVDAAGHAGGVVGNMQDAAVLSADLLVAGTLSGSTFVGGVCGVADIAAPPTIQDSSVYVTGALSGNYAGGAAGAISSTAAAYLRRNFVYVGPGATVAGTTQGAPFVAHRGNGGGTVSEDDRAHLDGTVSSGTGEAGLYLTSASGSANALTLERYQVTGGGGISGSGPGASPWVGGAAASSSASNCSWAAGVTGDFNADVAAGAGASNFVASEDLQSVVSGTCPEDPAHFWHLRALGPQVPPLLRAGKGTVVVTGADPFDGGTPLGRVTASVAPPAALHFEPTHDSNGVLQTVHISAQALGGADPLEPLGAAAWTGDNPLDLLTGSRTLARPVEFTGDVQPTVNGLQAPFPVLGGDSNGRLVLASVRDLQAMGQYGSVRDSNFVLAGSLDMAGVTWYGATVGSDLDGAGFGVSNLETSLVLDLGAGASVHDLTLSDPGVAQVPDAGALVCYAGAGAALSNCHVVVSAAAPSLSLGASNSGSFGWLAGHLDGASASGCSVRAAAAAATGAGATGALLVGRAGAGASVSNCFCCAEAGGGVTAGAAAAALVGRLEGASVVADCTALCRGAALQATEGGSYAGLVVGASDGDAAGTCRSNGVYALGAATLASSGAVGAVCGSAPGVVAGNAAFVGAAASVTGPRCGLVAGDAVGAGVHDLRDNWVRVDGSAAATTMAYPMGLAVGNMGGASALAVRRCIFEGTGTLTSAKDSASSSFFVGNDTAGAAALESNFWGGGLTVTGWGARTATNDGSSFRANADFTGALATGPAEFGPVAPAWWHPRGLASNAPALPTGGYRVVLEAGQTSVTPSVLGAVVDTTSNAANAAADRVLHVTFAGSNAALRTEALAAPSSDGAVALDALDSTWAVALPSNPIRVPDMRTSGDGAVVNGHVLPLAPLELQVWTLSNPSAYQAGDGALEIAASGGQSNWYTWSWSLDGGAPEAGSAARAVEAGQWTVAATTPDDPEAKSVTVDVLDGLGLVVTRYHPSTASGQDGRMEALARGGAGGGTWLWSGGKGAQSNAVGLPAGVDFTVTYSEDLPVVAAGVQGSAGAAVAAVHRLYEPMESGFDVSSDERVNLLFKKYARAPSTTTASAGLAGEATEMRARGVVRAAGDIYAKAVPREAPVVQQSWVRSGTSVTASSGGGTVSVAPGASAAALAAAHGLTEDVWQAFIDEDLQAAHELDGGHAGVVLQLERLRLRHVQSTVNIEASPAFYHPCLFDAIPSSAYGRLYPVQVTGAAGAGGAEHSFSSTDDGAWVLQPQAGVLQFMDGAGTTGALALFAADTDPESSALFNLVKHPEVTFYRYVGPKLDEFLSAGADRGAATLGDGAARLWHDGSNARVDVVGAARCTAGVLTEAPVRFSNVALLGDAAEGALVAARVTAQDGGAAGVRLGPAVLGASGSTLGLYDADTGATLLQGTAGGAIDLVFGGATRVSTDSLGASLGGGHAEDVLDIELPNLEKANIGVHADSMTLGFDYNYQPDFATEFTGSCGGLVGRTATEYRALYHTGNLPVSDLAVASCGFSTGARLASATAAGMSGVADLTSTSAAAWLGYCLDEVGPALLQSAANKYTWGLYRTRTGAAGVAGTSAGASLCDSAGAARVTAGAGDVQVTGDLAVTGDAYFDDLVGQKLLTHDAFCNGYVVSDTNNTLGNTSWVTIKSWSVDVTLFNNKAYVYYLAVSGTYIIHATTQSSATAACANNPTNTGKYCYSRIRTKVGSTWTTVGGRTVYNTGYEGCGPKLLPVSGVTSSTMSSAFEVYFQMRQDQGASRVGSVYDLSLEVVPVTPG